MSPKLRDRPELTALIEKARAAYAAMSPEDREAHDKAQRDSWVRGNIELDRLDREEGMTTPWAPVEDKPARAPSEEAQMAARAAMMGVCTHEERVAIVAIAIDDFAAHRLSTALPPSEAAHKLAEELYITATVMPRWETIEAIAECLESFATHRLSTALLNPSEEVLQAAWQAFFNSDGSGRELMRAALRAAHDEIMKVNR